MSRHDDLHELLDFKLPVTELSDRLRQYSWDFESDIVRLKPAHIITVLNKYNHGKIEANEVEEWANLIECREDIGMDRVTGEVLHVLANPILEGPITMERANTLIMKLREDGHKHDIR